MLPSSTRRSIARATLASVLVASLASLGSAAATARLAANGLPYSSASARTVQRQPAAHSCHARGSGLYALPDSHCTPGALNPAVTAATLSQTICRSGWTRSVRPAESITEAEKFASMRAYGDVGSPSRFEYDHLVPLELGGAPNDPRNLWPELDYAGAAGFYLNPKDKLERALNRLVCRGEMSLARAQGLIAREWSSAYSRYG